jgi:hypothetical protein
MLRLASLLALGCLTLAIASLLTTSKTVAEEPRQDRELEKLPANRCLVLTAAEHAPFHARFSMN